MGRRKRRRRLIAHVLASAGIALLTAAADMTHGFTAAIGIAAGGSFCWLLALYFL